MIKLFFIRRFANSVQCFYLLPGATKPGTIRVTADCTRLIEHERGDVPADMWTLQAILTGLRRFADREELPFETTLSWY